IQKTVEQITLRRDSHPHAVHVKPELESRPVIIAGPHGNEQAVDPSGKPVVESVQTNRPLHCPDCRRELAAGHNSDHRVEYLRCPNAPRDMKPCHAGCVVACGVAA
ncbi:MAG: hypothetical protein ACRDGI_11125, partial [Candidatus Limnocylindrales bacterium]